MEPDTIFSRNGPAAKWLGSAGAFAATAVSERLERYFVPDELLTDGTIDDQLTQVRYRRLVVTIVGASVILFVPSMAAAGVPVELWLPFLASTAVTAVAVVWSLLFVRAHSPLALLAAALSAVIVSGLAWVLEGYFHQVPLLFALVVAAMASIHGFRTALVMSACGSVLLPLATVPHPVILTDGLYTLMYLLGVGTVPWIYVQLRMRGSSALRASAKQYRDLVESVPAVVYNADFGPDGAWRYVSPRAAELLGFPAEEWTANPGFWWSRIHVDDRQRVLADEKESFGYPEGQRSRVEYRMHDRNGRVRWVRDEAVVVPGDDVGPDRFWTGFLTDITDRRELEEQLQHQAFHDPLTGLANRALFADRVEHALARAERRPNSVAVLFMDLDDFKTINDGMGHEAGDELLVAVGDAVMACVRPMDTAARLGGDEFAILLEDESDANSAVAVAERILKSLVNPFLIQGREVVVGASIGIARPGPGHDSAAEILRNADSAMYAAKRQGKGRHETFAPAMHAAAVERLELAGEMRRAMELGEYEVHYQPVVRLSDGSIAGFEALARWHHPVRGLIMPAEFIPAAEESGHIIQLGRLVLDEACRMARTWADRYSDGALRTMSVNVSARQFRDPDLPSAVCAALAGAGLEPSVLTLEITESLAMDDSDEVLARLRELKELGVRVAIDDFGTGYSSLSYLQRLPVDVLKMDQSFVKAMAPTGQGLELARVIVRMGRILKLETVAEGVELPSQASALRRMGCDLAQGFHFGRPMPAQEIEALLSQRAAQRLAS